MASDNLDPNPSFDMKSYVARKRQLSNLDPRPANAARVVLTAGKKFAYGFVAWMVFCWVAAGFVAYAIFHFVAKFW